MTVLSAADLPLYYNAVDILERNLAERARKTALLTDSREMTFQEVSDEANQVGRALQNLDVGFGDVVGILCFDQAEWVTGFFGTLKVGAVHLGMNTLLTPREFDYVLRDSRAKVLLVHEKLLESIDPIRDDAEFLEHVVVIGSPKRESDLAYQDWIAGEATELTTTATHREDFATLNYSSGTTGEPRASCTPTRTCP